MTYAPVHAKRQLSPKGALSSTQNDNIQASALAGRAPQNRAVASLEPTRVALSKKNASRAGKTLTNSLLLEAGGPEGPQNRCSRARETTTFAKRYALVYVKRYYLKLGPCWDAPRTAQGVGTFMPERPHPTPAGKSMAEHPAVREWQSGGGGP